MSFTATWWSCPSCALRRANFGHYAPHCTNVECVDFWKPLEREQNHQLSWNFD